MYNHYYSFTDDNFKNVLILGKHFNTIFTTKEKRWKLLGKTMMLLKISNYVFNFPFLFFLQVLYFIFFRKFALAAHVFNIHLVDINKVKLFIIFLFLSLSFSFYFCCKKIIFYCLLIIS